MSGRPRRILAIFNPTAGGDKRARFEAVVQALRGHGCAVTVAETKAPGHAEVIAREATPGAFDVIAAAGGDGTINEVINGLAGQHAALGIIPLGTANVLGEEIGLRRSPEAIGRALALGPIRPIHIGRVNERRFVMMAGVGFDANVVSRVSLALKRRIGALAYVWCTLRQALRDPFEGCEVTIDGRNYRSTSAVICNGRRYGGPFVAAPKASLFEDRFFVVLMDGRGWLSVLRYGLGLLLGRVTMWRDVRCIAGREIVICGASGQPIQADGDVVGTLPLRI